MNNKESAKNIKEVLKCHKVKLLEILPLESEIFLGKLEEAKILPQDSGASIRSISTRDKKTSYFLQYVIEPAADIYLPILLTVMEKCDHFAVSRLANEIKEKLNLGMNIIR